MNRAVYDRLKQVARQQTTISCSELAPLTDLDISMDHDRNEMSRILGEISAHEHEQKRPMPSAVVTHKDGDPGKGFYTLARELGVTPAGMSKIAFWSQELRNVHHHWSKGTP